MGSTSVAFSSVAAAVADMKRVVMGLEWTCVCVEVGVNAKALEVEIDEVILAWRTAWGRKEATLPERETKSDIVAML